ncbi:MAG: hypothetical protein ABL951_02535 [Alphaproteobacteria bacterium]
MGLKKLFKKVIKTAVKVAPLALAAGAVVMTAGAALGVTAAAGGWGGAITNLVARIGAKGILGSVLTGALTNAGYGAAIGAAGAALTGNSVSKGALMGAATGAVTGGITGGFRTPAPATGSVGVNLPNNAAPQMDAPGLELSRAGGAGVTPVSAQAPNGGFMNSAGNFLNSNSGVMIGTAVGNALSGIGAGIGAKAEADEVTKREEDRRAAVAANYALPAGGGMLTPASMAALEAARPQPEQRFSQNFSKPGYKWDPASNQIVYA